MALNRDFGKYEVVTLEDKVPKPNVPLRPVPSHILKPDYYETGIPTAVHLVSKGGITIAQKTEPEIKTQEQIQKLRDACKLARLVLNAVVRETKVRNYNFALKFQ